MYTGFLVFHSLLRWVVLLAGLFAFGRAVRGRVQGRAWEPADARAGLVFVASLDLQVTVGLVLYFALSPITKLALQDFHTAMGLHATRFWAVEHGTMALLGLVAAHVGRVRSRKATEASAKHGRAAVAYGMALLPILLAIPWPFLSYGRPLIRVGNESAASVTAECTSPPAARP